MNFNNLTTEEKNYIVVDLIRMATTYFKHGSEEAGYNRLRLVDKILSQKE